MLIRQIREAIAEENRKDIIERLWKGRQERVRRGLPPGGNVAYGFRRAGRCWAPADKEAEIIRAIFTLVDQGARPATIAQALNDEGRVRRNGKPWTHRQVASIVAPRSLYSQGLLRYGTSTGRDSALALLQPSG